MNLPCLGSLCAMIDTKIKSEKHAVFAVMFVTPSPSGLIDPCSPPPPGEGG